MAHYPWIIFVLISFSSVFNTPTASQELKMPEFVQADGLGYARPSVVDELKIWPVAEEPLLIRPPVSQHHPGTVMKKYPLRLQQPVNAESQFGSGLLCKTDKQIKEFANRFFGKNEKVKVILADINKEKPVCMVMYFLFDKKEKLVSLNYPQWKVGLAKLHITQLMPLPGLVAYGEFTFYGLMEIEQKEHPDIEL
jgi:hypothetical protein